MSPRLSDKLAPFALLVKPRVLAKHPPARIAVTSQPPAKLAVQQPASKEPQPSSAAVVEAQLEKLAVAEQCVQAANCDSLAPAKPAAQPAAPASATKPAPPSLEKAGQQHASMAAAGGAVATTTAYRENAPLSSSAGVTAAAGAAAAAAAARATSLAAKKPEWCNRCGNLKSSNTHITRNCAPACCRNYLDTNFKYHDVECNQRKQRAQAAAKPSY
jgi:hypothetical protein